MSSGHVLHYGYSIYTHTHRREVRGGGGGDTLQQSPSTPSTRFLSAFFFRLLEHNAHFGSGISSDCGRRRAAKGVKCRKPTGEWAAVITQVHLRSLGSGCGAGGVGGGGTGLDGAEEAENKKPCLKMGAGEPTDKRSCQNSNLHLTGWRYSVA